MPSNHEGGGWTIHVEWNKKCSSQIDQIIQNRRVSDKLAQHIGQYFAENKISTEEVNEQNTTSAFNLSVSKALRGEDRKTTSTVLTKKKEIVALIVGIKDLDLSEQN